MISNAVEHGRVVEILLVEDNMGDVDLAREGLVEGKIRNNLNVAMDGEEAMAYLRRQGRFANAVRPDLILLDLNLPRKDGREVLSEIKSDDNLKDIPVVVMTTSKSEEDILRSYQLHANCFITKPLSFSRFTDIVREIGEFWFAIVTLPSGKQK
jgi:chemotaxis family two-component system response regulator Rcp1